MNDGSDSRTTFGNDMVPGQQNTNSWHTLTSVFSTDGNKVCGKMCIPVKSTDHLTELRKTTFTIMLVPRTTGLVSVSQVT